MLSPSPLPRHLLSRSSTTVLTTTHQQIRHASLIKRPKTPYTFTQLITLSDGSTFTHRTTSPQPVYVSVKDTKNNPLWNPSSQKLLNIEEDEAGRLRRFRERFGRGYDAEMMSDMSAEASEEGESETAARRQEESLMDLIAGYGLESGGGGGAEREGKTAGKKEATAAAKKSGKGKGGEK